MKKTAMLAALFAAGAAFAATPANFAAEAKGYLAAHEVTGVDSFQSLLRLIGEPCGEAVAVDAAVQPRHKARKVRCWGPMMLSAFRSWGIAAEEFDPDAAARGDLPDVLFVTQGPGYSQGDVDMIFRTAAEGVHVVTLNSTDQWSREIAKRLGFSYDGVLTIGSPSDGGAIIPCCPKLFEGFPAKPRLDAELGAIGKWLHGMYLTGDRCLMCAADAGQGRIATAVAQYPVGRGAVTLFGPRLYEIGRASCRERV